MSPSTYLRSATFLDSPLARVGDVESGKIVISGAPYDAASLGRFGARLGPNAIRQGSRGLAGRLKQVGVNGLVDIESGQRISLQFKDALLDLGDATIYPTDVAKTTESISSLVASVVRRGGWSIVLGGDHYISYPAVRGFAHAAREISPNVRIGYIHIDAHLDFVGPNMLGKYHNGTHAQLASELPNIVKSSMAFVGVASWMAKSEVDAIEGAGGVIYSANDVHRQGAASVMRRAADHASKNSDLIYLTVDLDVIDCGYLPGRSGVDTMGVRPEQLEAMLATLASYPIAAMDLVEVNPRLDPSGRSASIAVEMLMTMLATRKSFTPKFLASQLSPRTP